MTNPVLAKAEAFSSRPTFVAPEGQQGFERPGEAFPTYNPSQQPPQGPYAAYVPPQPGQGYPSGPYAEPGPGQPGWPQQSWQAPTPPAEQKVMTLDDVLTKTAITVGATIVVAVLTVWATFAGLIPVPVLLGAGVVCGLATIIFAFVVALRRKVGPAVAIPFAILEGFFIGAISLLFEMYYPGIVLQAVLATFVAAGMTLAAFRFGGFRLSSKVRKIVTMSMMAFVGVALVNLVLALTGVGGGLGLGLFPGPTGAVSGWAWIAALVGVVLAVFSLIDDFQYIEQGIANRAPASESWRAAYGLTVTLVWLYVNLLRILSYIRR